MEDKQIIDLYLDRSEQAIVESENKYGKFCRTIAINILSDYMDAEECVNDTWLKAWNVIPPTIPQILRAFFGKIARNISINRYKALHAEKRGGWRLEVALEELEDCISLSGSGEWSVDQTVLTDVLNHFLEGLSPVQRKIFVCRYWYMDSIREIAIAQGLGESMVKMTLLRTRKELARILQKEGIEY